MRVKYILVLAVIVIVAGPIFYARLQGSAERNRNAEAVATVIFLLLVAVAIFVAL